MNTRIQVEHPVTEMVTGIDLIREQIRIAFGRPLSVTQEEIRNTGHAIECRINAEDAENGFRPCPGKIKFLHIPGGFDVRVDTALYTGYETSPYYDSMIAKVIVHAPTRMEAIRRMRRALEELMIKGIKTNADFSYLIMHDPDFIKGNYDTSFIEKKTDVILSWDKCSRPELKS
jgi:acetyl-CoA carboxylase biotin carboxylase subunit